MMVAMYPVELAEAIAGHVKSDEVQSLEKKDIVIEEILLSMENPI